MAGQLGSEGSETKGLWFFSSSPFLVTVTAIKLILKYIPLSIAPSHDGLQVTEGIGGVRVLCGGGRKGAF